MLRRTVLLGLACVLAACGNHASSHPPLDGSVDADIDAAIDAAPDADLNADVDGDGAPLAVDCDDTNAAVHPGALERCNTIDDDCDQTIDETSAIYHGDGLNPIDVSHVFAAGTPDAPIVYRSPPGAGTLRLCGGTYYAHIEVGSTLEIAGAGAATTIIDAANSGRVVRTLSMDATINIHDVTLTRGSTPTTPGLGSGGGVLCRNGTLTVTNAVISASTASERGGGVMLDGCAANFTDVTITGNQTDGPGGGLYISTAPQISNSLTRVTVTANTAAQLGGGVMHNTSAPLSLTDSTVSGNTSSNVGGGGIYTAGPFTCTNSAIVGNTGLGIYSVGFSTVTSTSCDFGTTAATNNTPNDVRATNGAFFDYGDDASFTCSNTGCN